MWYTNLDIQKRHEKLILWQRYYDDDGNPLPDAEERYPHYDNYDAINVDRVADIPVDYRGVMGVPITFMDKYNPDEFEIVNPSISVLAQPSVAVVDEVAENRGTEEVSREYLNYLYSDDAQRIAAENYYRPVNQEILEEYSDVFDLNMELKTIDDFGGWQEVQWKHFADGGVFDRIYGN